LAQELPKEKYCHLDLDSTTFFKKRSEVRKVYSFKSPLSKSQKGKMRRKSRKDKHRILITFSDSGGLVGARKYILDSGASFHLVDDETLTKEEKDTIETCKSITSETANGEFVVSRRCKIYVKELDIYVWAFLHRDTVCVLSLGLIADRSGFTFVWKPGKAPTLTKGKITITSQPNHNVPFIYASKYLEARKALRERNNPVALPSSASKKKKKNVPDFDQVVQEEMKGLEELIPQPADVEDMAELSDGAPGLVESSSEGERPNQPSSAEYMADTSEGEMPHPPPKLEATPRTRRRKERSRP